jgi:hypothetical protein
MLQLRVQQQLLHFLDRAPLLHGQQGTESGCRASPDDTKAE